MDHAKLLSNTFAFVVVIVGLKRNNGVFLTTLNENAFRGPKSKYQVIWLRFSVFRQDQFIIYFFYHYYSLIFYLIIAVFL